MMAQAGQDLVHTMAPRVLAAMQKDTGSVTPQGYDRGLADLELLRDAVVHGRFFYFLDIPWVLIYLFVLYIIHPLVGLIALAGAAMATVFQLLLRMLARRRYTLWDVGFEAGRSMVETGKNRAQLLPVMGLGRGLARKYLDRYAAVLKFKTGAERFHDSVGAVIGFVQTVTVAGVFTAATLAFFKDEITVGMMFAGVMIGVRIMGPLEKHLWGMKGAIDAVNAHQRLTHFVAPALEPEKTELPEPAGAVQVKGLTLAVSGRALIQNISLELDPGQMLGVIGPCDAGKSVLCRMLSGIWPGSAGEIRLDGALISQWPASELGRYIGYMPQEPDLLPGTVAENIARFSRDSAEKVIAAARAAGVHDLILKLPQGYDTPIVQAGTRLSAGRRQLISLARALYGTPRFMVMDDPQTFLDDAGLRTLQAAIQALKQQRITTVVVTDRPAILSNMDKLLVIKDGKAVMYGPADTVMAQLANRQQPTHPSAGV
jgi:ATP-binding cassette, subfamily C, bacterial EexD